MKYVQYGIMLSLVVLLLTSCGESIGGEGKSAVFLSADVQAPYLVACDVYLPGTRSHVADDVKNVNIRSIYKGTSTTTRFADVLLDEYRVEYFRLDGSPKVPAPFVELGQHLLAGGGTLSLQILVIRADAKLKSPLKELAFGGGEGEIMFTAHITFYGNDLAGNAVQTEVDIPVTARDY